MTTDPEELDPELDVDLGAEELDEDEDEDEDGLPEGFVVEGDDDDDAAGDDIDDDANADGDPDDDAGAVVLVGRAAVPLEPDDFEEDLAPVVSVPDEEDEAPARRAGEFVCTRCFLVKRDSQLAVRSRKICRDCA